MPIKLSKVDIGPNRYWATFKRISDGAEISIQVLENNIEGVVVSSNQDIQTLLQNYELIKHATKISFSTLSENLSDKEYATQENGFHWVKIPGYKVIKIKPEHIDSKGTLSSGGQAYIEACSEVE